MISTRDGKYPVAVDIFWWHKWMQSRANCRLNANWDKFCYDVYEVDIQQFVTNWLQSTSWIGSHGMTLQNNIFSHQRTFGFSSFLLRPKVSCGEGLLSTVVPTIVTQIIAGLRESQFTAERHSPRNLFKTIPRIWTENHTPNCNSSWGIIVNHPSSLFKITPQKHLFLQCLIFAISSKSLITTTLEPLYTIEFINSEKRSSFVSCT